MDSNWSTKPSSLLAMLSLRVSIWLCLFKFLLIVVFTVPGSFYAILLCLVPFLLFLKRREAVVAKMSTLHYFLAVLRSQNYLISTLAPVALFSLFWLQLLFQPYFNTLKCFLIVVWLPIKTWPRRNLQIFPAAGRRLPSAHVVPARAFPAHHSRMVAEAGVKCGFLFLYNSTGIQFIILELLVLLGLLMFLMEEILSSLYMILIKF